jgi:hypothetical protein
LILLCAAGVTVKAAGRLPGARERLVAAERAADGLVVTGASGFIGRNVLRCAPRAWQITARTITRATFRRSSRNTG